MLCIGLLGVFSISAGEDVIAEDAWRLRKAKTLIKLLALAPERRLHAEEAAELLWAGRDPDFVRNNLHQAFFGSVPQGGVAALAEVALPAIAAMAATNSTPASAVLRLMRAPLVG